MESKTHEYITKTAINTLNTSYFLKHEVLLIEYCKKPDEDETDGAYRYHFYNPVTRQNFAGGKDSALTRAISHYNNGVKNKDMQELGRCLHFVQDLCTPVHVYYEDTGDAVFNLSYHVKFEDMCNDIIKKEWLLEDNEYMIKNSLYYTNNRLKALLKGIALKTSMLANELIYDPKITKERREEIGKKSIMNGIRHTIGIMHRYYEELGEELY